MNYITKDTVKAIHELREKVVNSGIKQQKEKIKEDSPYSDSINNFISNYEEFRVYHNLALKEAIVTRPALIKDIDLDMFVTSEGCTNRELMLKGDAPYSYDAEDGKIEIHHIGQRFDSPFAELSFNEHMMFGNNKIIHGSKSESWRNKEKNENKFNTERAEYWKKRVKGDYTIKSTIDKKDLPDYYFELQEDLRNEIKETIETLFKECSVSDLNYLSDLANTYSLLKQTGASSLNEFLYNTRVENGQNLLCPACNSSYYVLNGTYTAGNDKIQQYKCKDCGKYFTAANNSLVSGSSFSFSDWLKFIDCLYNGYTLSQLAKACDITEKTAQENRIKLFYAMKLLDDKVKLRGSVVIDETFVPVSYKGNHSKQKDFIMPRDPHERGHENHEKGLGKNQVCIVCALDDCGNSVAHICGTGNPSAKKLGHVLNDYINKDELLYIYSDESRAINKFANDNGYPISQAKQYRKGTKKAKIYEHTREAFITNRYIQTMNAYHSRLKRFLFRFSGTSTKILSGYLYLFAWKERNRDRDPVDAYKELLAVMTTPGIHLSAGEIKENGYLPDINELDRKKPRFPNLERDLEIYRRYAEGESYVSIGKSYNMSKQRVEQIIKKLKKNGYAYKTVNDKKKEAKRVPTPENRFRIDEAEDMLRDYMIYEASKTWNGSAKEFHKEMAEKYNISERKVGVIISNQKRIEQYKEAIYIYDDFSYKSREEVYEEIYSEYQSLRTQNPEITQVECYKIISEKTGYTENTIMKLVYEISNDSGKITSSKDKRLTKENLINRDKAIYIDFLNWDGDRKSFCKWAAEKYHLSNDYVHRILRFFFIADYKRLDNLEIKQRKERKAYYKDHRP